MSKIGKSLIMDKSCPKCAKITEYIPKCHEKICLCRTKWCFICYQTYENHNMGIHKRNLEKEEKYIKRNIGSYDSDSLYFYTKYGDVAFRDDDCYL